MESFAHQIAGLAQRAILYEASTSPKPGLVDPLDQGAHKDMDFFTFMASSSSIYKGMYECVITGMKHQSSSDILKNLRYVGIQCEKDMFVATKGVNTHKGIIFSMGLVCAAVGMLQARGEKIGSKKICDVVKFITKKLVENDFSNLSSKKELTEGERFFKEYGIKGIRGEVESGFPTVIEKGLPVLMGWERTKKISKNDAFLLILLNIMTIVEDTNIISRGGLKALNFVQKSALKFIQDGGMSNPSARDRLLDMNKEFKNKNISPGGAADLLAVTIFLGIMDGIEL